MHRIRPVLADRAMLLLYVPVVTAQSHRKLVQQADIKQKTLLNLKSQT